MKPAIRTEVAIVGAGISGTLVSAMLDRSGTENILIDPRTEYPDEFRCEKFNAQQIELMHKTGVAEEVFNAITPLKDVWMSRLGRLVRKQHYPHYGFSYNTVVNSLRKQVVKNGRFHQGTVGNIETSSEFQTISLNDGTEISARLVVLCSGANRALQEKLGFRYNMLSERHCLAIGFNVEPSDNADFPFDTMTYWPEAASGKMSYLTFFRSGNTWRANMFGYWNARDETIKSLRSEPEDCLHSLMPGLESIVGRFTVSEGMRIRPIDLYQWEPGQTDGIVALGDALSSSCPGAGTGTTKAVNDALQVCETHIPNWLATPGMTASKIASFYEDSEKQKIDMASQSEAFKLRSMTLDPALKWKMQRLGRYYYHLLRGHPVFG